MSRDPDDDFDADMAYLRGLSDAIFEHASQADLTAIAQRVAASQPVANPYADAR